MRLFSLLLFALGLVSFLPAQRTSYSEVDDTYFNKSGALYTDGQISGYYIVNYKKTSKKEGHYVLQLLDQELNKMGEKSFAGKKDIQIGKIAYNGSLLAVEMFNHEDEKKWLEFYDATGEFQHRRSLTYTHYDTPANQEVLAIFAGVPLVAVPNGFLHYAIGTTGKNQLSKSAYRITFLPNDPEAKTWTARSSSKSSDYEGAIHLDNNDELVVFAVYRRGGLMSQKFSMEVKAYDIKTGKKVFAYTPNDKDIQTRYHTARIFGDKVVVAGISTGKKNKIFTDVPEAIDVVTLGMAGKKQQKTSIPLEDQLAKFTTKKSKGNIFVHDIGMTSSGDMLVAAEFYRTFNGDIKAMNGALIHLKPDMSVGGVQAVEKGSTGGLMGNTLAGGLSMNKGSAVAAMAKIKGKFDFAFLDKVEDALTVAYFSGHSEWRKTKKFSLHVHSLLDGQLLKDKITFATGTDRVTVLPAKEGYVAVLEYNSKKKSLDVHMERLSI